MYLQEAKGGNDSNVHRRTDGLRKCGAHAAEHAVRERAPTTMTQGPPRREGPRLRPRQRPGFPSTPNTRPRPREVGPQGATASAQPRHSLVDTVHTRAVTSLKPYGVLSSATILALSLTLQHLHAEAGSPMSRVSLRGTETLNTAGPRSQHQDPNDFPILRRFCRY